MQARPITQPAFVFASPLCRVCFASIPQHQRQPDQRVSLACTIPHIPLLCLTNAWTNLTWGISFVNSNLSKSSTSAVISYEFCRPTLRGFRLSKFSQSQRTRSGSCPSAWPKWPRSKSSNLKGTLSAFLHGMRCRYHLQVLPMRDLEERAR